MDLEIPDKREKLFSIELCELETENISIACRDKSPDDNLAHQCIVSTATNQHFYGSKQTSILTPNVCYQSNYYVEEKDMKQFLKEAAENIENSDSLEEDPMNKFSFKYRSYVALLALLTIFFCYCICDTIRFTINITQNNEDSAFGIKFIELGLLACYYFNSALQIATILIGFYAVKSLKISIFKLHSVMIVFCSLLMIPLIFNNKLYFIPFICWDYCYFHCKDVESIIYNSLVFDTLCKINNPAQRLRFKEIFVGMKHSEPKPSLELKEAFFRVPQHKYTNFTNSYTKSA